MAVVAVDIFNSFLSTVSVLLLTNYGAKNILVQTSCSELTKSSDITIRFVMRASNNVCVFHSIYL